MQLPDIGESDAIFAYLRGLNPKVRELVRTQKDNLADLCTLQLACLRIETPHDRDQTSQEDAAHIASSTSTIRRGTGSRGRGGFRGRGSNRGNHPYRKNTSEQTKDQNAPPKYPCFLCDSPNHYANKCPDLSKMREAYNSHAASTSSANLTIGATIIDSGATQHMFNQIDDFRNISRKNTMITCANSQDVQSTHIGSIDLSDEINLEDVLCVPKLHHNLISVRVLNKSGNDVTFKSDGDIIQIDDDNNIIKIGQAIGDLFHLSTGGAYLTESNQSIDTYTL